MALDPTAKQAAVREHERHECDLPVEVRIGADDRQRFVLVSSIGTKQPALPMRIADVSTGGCALVSKTFVPVGCRLLIDTGAEGDVASLEGSVSRVTMVDHTPMYKLGVAFAGSDFLGAEAIARLIGGRSDAGRAA